MLLHTLVAAFPAIFSDPCRVIFATLSTLEKCPVGGQAWTGCQAAFCQKPSQFFDHPKANNGHLKSWKISCFDASFPSNWLNISLKSFYTMGMGFPCGKCCEIGLQFLYFLEIVVFGKFARVYTKKAQCSRKLNINEICFWSIREWLAKSFHLFLLSYGPNKIHKIFCNYKWLFL